jgi:FHS family glucose/mannose:H+ symporter-like MFS transporter
MASSQVEISRTSNPAPNRKLVLAGQLAFLPTGVLTTLLGPMLPILIARWAMNDTQAGNLFLVQFLASLAGVQWSGFLLTRFGFRPAFLLGLLLMAGGVGTLYLGSHIEGLISVAVYGLGLGLIVPTANLLIAEISTGTGLASRAGAVSLLNFFWGVGAVFCSLMVAWSAAHGFVPFFLGAVALFLVVLAWTMRDLPFPEAAKPGESSTSWRTLSKSSTVWLFAVVFFLYPGAETAVGGWIGSYVLRLGLRGMATASIMPAIYWSALTAGRALGTAFLRHFSEDRVLRLGYAAATSGIGVMLWVPSLPGVIAGAIITGLSFATLYPITVARLSQRYGVATRTIGAVMFSLATLGPAMIPWLVGIVSHATGSLRWGLFLPFVATLILFLIHLVQW